MNSMRPVKKHRPSALILTCFVILLICTPACTLETATPLTKVRLPMGYVANVQFSPFYVGVARGYFEEAGFDLTFDYRWETDGIQLVAAGEIPFALASGDQVIQARSQGLPVVAVAAWYQQFPVAIIASETQPLTSPKDLQGLRIGIPETFGASYIGLRALLKAGGLSEADIELQAIGYTQLAALTTGSVDAVVVYANNEPAVLTQKAIPFNALYVAEYADLVSAVVVSSDTMIEQHPDQVRAFVGAFLKGLEDVLNDPDAAFEISKDYIEGLEENAAAQRAVLETTLAYWRPQSGTDLGEFSRSAWEQAQEVMLQADLIKKPVPTEALFTNKFTP